MPDGRWSRPPHEALALRLEESALGAKQIQGLPTSLMATIAEPASPLHDSCIAMRTAGGELLRAAQDDGSIRADVDSSDLFALVAALSWLGDQANRDGSEDEDRPHRLLDIVLDGLAAPPASAPGRAKARDRRPAGQGLG